MAAICSFDTSRDEAAWSVDVADLLLQVNPNARVGIMARTKNRRREVDQGLVARCIEHCLWDDPIVDASVASIVRQALRAFDPSFDGDDTQLIHHLWALTRALKPYDIDTMRMVNDVFEWVAQQRTAGMDISELGSRIQVTDGDSVVKLPGIHLLNGHTGKGQQFDWALVVGLEQRNLPDYRSLVGDALNEERRVLSVMISRARLGIILSSAVSVPGWDGRSKDHDRSVFLDCFNEVEKITSPTEVTEWIQSRC
jgi:DNA helicase-2/ATP-dependent DNA helicase PcrA